MAEQSGKTFLVLKFAKLPLGAIHVVEYSVAGEETVAQVPDLKSTSAARRTSR